jgi:hypothetical protein
MFHRADPADSKSTSPILDQGLFCASLMKRDSPRTSSDPEEEVTVS